MKYIVGNWKSNKSLAEVQTWAQLFQREIATLIAGRQDLKVILCPPSVYLDLLCELLPDVALGAQTLSPFPNGAYTGAISAQIAKEYVKFSILGHAERRKYFGETDVIVANQAIQALENAITPIIAVEKKNWSSQLSQLSADQLKNVLVMYEPAEAISTAENAHAADLDEVIGAAKMIKNEYPVKGVLYGGSVSATNVQLYIQEPALDGVVPGHASLDAQEFMQIISAALGK